jgi:hypothetical protein
VAKQSVQKADVAEILWCFVFVVSEILILPCGNSVLKDITIVIDKHGI